MATDKPSRLIRWGDYEKVRKFETPQELPEEAREILLKILPVQADTEFASVQQHRPWLDKAPTLDDRWIQARLVADEMRHGWQICQVLKDFGPEGEDRIKELLERREGQHKLDAFNIPFDRWSDVLAYTSFVDRVGVYQLRMFEECSYAPLARAIPLMLHEEQAHINFGLYGLRKMVKEGPKYYGSKEEAQEAVYKWYPRALDMFGHSHSITSELSVVLGLKKWRNEEARELFIKEVTPLIEGIGLKVPPPDYDRRIL